MPIRVPTIVWLSFCAGCPAPTPAVPPTAAATPVVGRACTQDADCGPGFRCHDDREGSAQVPSGYCLMVGACSPRDDACPEGTVCSPLPWCQIPGVCLRTCDSDADCRTGFACAPVELFPGEPDSPRTAVPVCWTAPEPDVAPPEPVPVDAQACREGDAAACVAAALESGQAGRLDEALELVEQACSLASQGIADHPAACVHHVYGVADIRTDALIAFCDDCIAGVEAACGLEPFATAVLAAADGGCDAGDAAACVRAGALRRSGCGTAVDPMQAVRNFARACDGAGAPGCPGLTALYADPAVQWEVSPPPPPCPAEPERPEVGLSEDGFLELAGFPAVSRDGKQVASHLTQSDLAANERSWIEILDAGDGSLLETWRLLEVEDAAQGEWPEEGSPAFRRLEARVDAVRRRLERRGFRSLAPLGAPATAASCGPVIATGSTGGGMSRIVVRDPGPGTVWWQKLVVESVGVPDCGPDEHLAMLQEAVGWFDPEGDLMVVQRVYLALPDWCDNVVETDLVRRTNR